MAAHCLSRAVIGAVQLGLDYLRMATDQASDHGVQTLKASDTGLRLEEARSVTRAQSCGVTSSRASLDC